MNRRRLAFASLAAALLVASAAAQKLENRAVKDPSMREDSVVRATEGIELRVALDTLFDADAAFSEFANEASAADAAQRPSQTPPKGAAPSEAKASNGVPFLRDIPVVGTLFKNQPPPSKLSPLEAWLAEYLPRAVGSDLKIRFEELRTRRYDAERQEISTKRDLVVSGGGDALKKAAKVLEALTARRDDYVKIAVLIAHRPAPPDAVAHETIDLLDAAAFAASIEGLKKSTRSGAPGREIISAPQLMTRQGQRATIEIGGRISFVRNFALDVVGENSIIVDPQVDSVAEGLSIDVLPVLYADGATARISLGVRNARVLRPIPTFEAKLADSKVKVERPEVSTQRFESAFVVPLDGGGAHVDGLLWTDPETKRPTFAEIFVQLVVVHPEDASRPRVKVFTESGDAGVVILDVRDRAELANIATGATLEVVRAGGVEGRWHVERAADGLLVLRREAGRAPNATDEIRVAK